MLSSLTLIIGIGILARLTSALIVLQWIMFWCVSRWKAVAGGVNDSIMQAYSCMAYLRVRPV